MHPHHEHFFVIGTIENPDPATLRQTAVGPPEEVVVQVFGGRLLEAEDLAALRVYPGHHMLDRAVLASGVHRLEDEQERPLVLGVKLFLKLLQKRNAVIKKVFSLAFGAQTLSICGIKVFQTERWTVIYAECFCQL